MTTENKSATASNGQDLWIVGRFRPRVHKRWEFQGVFDSEAKAIKACHGPAYFAFRTALNVELPKSRIVQHISAQRVGPIIQKSGVPNV